MPYITDYMTLKKLSFTTNLSKSTAVLRCGYVGGKMIEKGPKKEYIILHFCRSAHRNINGQIQKLIIGRNGQLQSNINSRKGGHIQHEI